MGRRCLPLVALAVACACSSDTPTSTAGASPPTRRTAPPPPLDPTNIVSIASASKDHTTLVAALQAADYVKSVANPGPLTVFAPTDAAFALLPKEALARLLEPQHRDELRDVLKYHVAPSVYEFQALTDGMQLGMANGKKTTFRVAGGKTTVDGATILASIRASNGIVHVVDRVLLPASAPAR
jgi:uncharacterized surface protein with fasciclin (FAS1) repeats